MALTRETDLGKIVISNEVFKAAIEDACLSPNCAGKIWLSSKPGIEAEYDENGRVTLEFSAVIKFGASIKVVSRELADIIAEHIKKRSGDYPSLIKVNIVGIKSKNTVKRSVEVLCEY